jgi:predicted RNA methylase
MMRMGLVSDLKNMIVSPERKPRRILAGPFRDIVMGLSLQSQTQVYLGLFEKEIHPWLYRLSKGIATAIDIGAAHGEYTLYFLTRTKATKVFAFEPDVSSFQYLRANLRLNALDQSPRLEISAKLLGASDTQQEVQLDSLATGLQTPCFIKMDVDGAEGEVLKGARAINAFSDVRWLIETHSSELESICERMLTAAGFQTRIIPNAAWRVFIPERRPIEHNRWLAAWKSN